MPALTQRIRSASPQLVWFLIAVAMLGIAGRVFDTTFNNYLDDVHQIGNATRGYLEFPRELPGFLTALMAGMLFFLPETRVAGFCALAVAAGMFGMAIFGHQWLAMLAFMILWSAGTHLIMPIQSSVSMVLATRGRHGRRLGQVRGASLAAAVVGYVLIWVGMKFLGFGYRTIFTAAGVAALLAAGAFFMMRLPEAHLARPKFVWNRRYWLFYLLALLFGARKQIFITFGPWVLVRIFEQKAPLFAMLGFIGAVVGMFFQPLLGNLIDRLGERAILMIDSVLVLGVCGGYAVSGMVEDTHSILWLPCVCYVLDMLLFGVNMARTTYLRKIAVKDADVSPTLAAGITIDHAVSMSVPTLGGLIWVAFGYTWVFVLGAGIAVLMLVFTSMVRTPGRE